MSPVQRQTSVLQPLFSHPVAARAVKLPGDFYVPATPETVRWGFLPDKNANPVLQVTSGAVITFDTVSHEGMLEDQGLDPLAYFGGFGVKRDAILRDAITLAGSLEHDFVKDGPHCVLGPVAVEHCVPGDTLKIEMLSMLPRVPYGIISNRHGKGALAGEFPENEGEGPGACAARPHLFGNVSKFVPLRRDGKNLRAILAADDGRQTSFSAEPFMGILGVAPGESGRFNSIPPGEYGGNIDIRHLIAPSTLYLPVFVPGALFYVGDPHFAQGNGEVALSALEGSLRATVRLSVLKAGKSSSFGVYRPTGPFAEVRDYWIPTGLDPDLNEAMKKATRQAIRFLSEAFAIDRATALAYLSAASDFEITQVVNRTKGIHALIRKKDFQETASRRSGRK